ncbi:MAG: hypothetical protein HKO59_05490 [Phycisphaerales bacterium]|nr:hypothetical protein [Phycisphaerales bacterium]
MRLDLLVRIVVTAGILMTILGVVVLFGGGRDASVVGTTLATAGAILAGTSLIAAAVLERPQR